ncbi:MAG: hypothetical protein COC19_05360 [SAR86 cluster bacterium]|uniref:ABC transporter permease n=1 Tax=SAR86 cluster bacterium TaxID=2030880 RepID=A0A2A4MM85_9GAMM|nr:MAG: hypothetical protein COC19_05360 [SAR86 cluster bacterium]
MNGFLTGLRAELYVSLRSFSSKLIILAPSLLVMAQYIITKLGQSGQQARDGLLGSSGDSMASNNAYGYYVDGLSTGLSMLGLILVAYAAHSFAYDRDTGLIRHLIIRRISRRALLLVKLCHIHLLALVSLLMLMLVARLGSGLFWEFSAVVEDGFELISVDEIRSEIFLGLKLALLPLPAVIAFGLFISVIAKTATQAITTALGISLAMDVFKSSLGDFAHYLFASFQSSLLDQSYLQEVSRIVRGYSDVLIDERVLQLNLWIPLPEMVLLVLATLFLVQRKKL